MDGLMRGKSGLIMGVANDHSIAWGFAQKLAEHGAELAFTYQGEAFGKRVKPLADKIGASLVLPCDVEDSASVAQVFSTLAGHWGTLDFLVHAIGFSDKNELKGLYADTSKENFTRTMVVSCYSFTEVTRHAAAIMPEGGSQRMPGSPQSWCPQLQRFVIRPHRRCAATAFERCQNILASSSVRAIWCDSSFCG